MPTCTVFTPSSHVNCISAPKCDLTNASGASHPASDAERVLQAPSAQIAVAAARGPRRPRMDDPGPEPDGPGTAPSSPASSSSTSSEPPPGNMPVRWVFNEMDNDRAHTPALNTVYLSPGWDWASVC